MIREEVVPKEAFVVINPNRKKSWKGREVDDRGSIPKGGAICSKKSPFAIDAKGEEKFCWQGSLFWRGVMVL